MAIITRTVPIRLTDSADGAVAATVREATRVKREVSELAWNAGAPLSAPRIQKEAYHRVRAGSPLNSQLVISAFRVVAGAYSSARTNDNRRAREHKKRAARAVGAGRQAPRPPRRALDAPFRFHRESALFLVGERGRDADFRADGSLSISTVAGRHRVAWSASERSRRELSRAVRINSVTVALRRNAVLGFVSYNLEVPDPRPGPVVGIDRGEVVPVAAASPGATRIWDDTFSKRRDHRNKRRSELQSLLADRKAHARDTRSVRRAMKRLGRKNANAGTSFARETAASVCAWAPPGATLVLEDLTGINDRIRARKDIRARLSLWPHRKMLDAFRARAERDGLVVETVSPRYTSQICAECGARGIRRAQEFRCACGYSEHADINAARNIRARYIQGRSQSSSGPTLRGEGKRIRKPPPSGGGH